MPVLSETIKSNSLKYYSLNRILWNSMDSSVGNRIEGMTCI